jgi:hypothetical protein
MSCSEYDYDCKDCTDAWELSRMYGCKESPNPVLELEREVEIDDCIEVNQGGERFWLLVTDVCTCFVIGIVLSNLRFDHIFNTGDKLKVTTQQIYNVDKKCENL